MVDRVGSFHSPTLLYPTDQLLRAVVSKRVLGVLCASIIDTTRDDFPHIVRFFYASIKPAMRVPLYAQR